MVDNEQQYTQVWREVDYTQHFTEDQIEAGAHRVRVGGKWEKMGRLQYDFLLSQGLQPGHRVLDVGCGALRGGVHFVDYLEPSGYYGVDVNESLLDAGYAKELTDPLRDKLPRDHLRATDRFDCDFGVQFDVALAQSLFTHVSLNHIRLCLVRVARAVRPGGRFFATFFEVPPDHPVDAVLPGRQGRWTERNPFFYYRQDLRWAAEWAPWDFRYIGGWGHPQGQRMVEFRRR